MKFYCYFEIGEEPEKIKKILILTPKGFLHVFFKEDSREDTYQGK
jgi:hypothetical protein